MGTDGTILFAPGFSDELYRIPASGGDAKPATALDRRHTETAHLWPSFLPDGKHFFLCIRAEKPEFAGVFVGSVDSSERIRVLDSDTNAQYAKPGVVLFAKGDGLMAQPFDASTFKTSGSQVRIAERLWFRAGSQTPGVFAASENGVLVYGAGNSGSSFRLVWVDRGGQTIRQVTEHSGFVMNHMSLSRDGRHIAVEVPSRPGINHIWLNSAPDVDVTPFTFGEANDRAIVWSPSAREVLWASARSELGLYKKAANGSGTETLVWQAPAGIKSANDIQPTDWSPDGRYVIFQRVGDTTRSDLWTLSLDGSHQAQPLIQTPAEEGQGKFSPDGQWVAYTSNESGRLEVYVQPFPVTGAKWQVSTAGGMLPEWRGDGRELFFLVPGTGRVMSSDVTIEGTFHAGSPRQLFQQLVGLSHGSEAGGHYGVAPDGQRFILGFVDEGPVESLNVLVNWASDLAR